LFIVITIVIAIVLLVLVLFLFLVVVVVVVVFHAFIVTFRRFIGCAVREDLLWLVTEFCSLGSVENFISSRKKEHGMSGVSLFFKLLCLLDAAKGMSFLHKHGVFHLLQLDLI
jgi:serine/threonine protein kinase